MFAAHPMAFCQMPCVFNELDVCMRLFAGIRTRPAVAGMFTGSLAASFLMGEERGLQNAIGPTRLSQMVVSRVAEVLIPWGTIYKG